MVNIVEALGIDAADAAPDFRCHIHIRLLAGETPRPYTGARHHDERYHRCPKRQRHGLHAVALVSPIFPAAGG